MATMLMTTKQVSAKPPNSRTCFFFLRTAAAGLPPAAASFSLQYPEDIMSAHSIFEDAPIGSIVAWSDGTPRPPERFTRKLAAWRNNNSKGRLIQKEPPRSRPTYSPPAGFTLHEADFGSGGVIAIRVHRSFSVDTTLQFTVVERPVPGSVRVFDRAGDNAELVHLAPHRAAAEEWLSRHGYPNAVLDDVTADAVAADVVEGRVA